MNAVQCLHGPTVICYARHKHTPHTHPFDVRHCRHGRVCFITEIDACIACTAAAAGVQYVAATAITTMWCTFAGRCWVHWNWWTDEKESVFIRCGCVHQRQHTCAYIIICTHKVDVLLIFRRELQSAAAAWCVRDRDNSARRSGARAPAYVAICGSSWVCSCVDG